MVVTKVFGGKLEMKHCGLNVSEESGQLYGFYF
jgi:hypothetical protein